MVKTELAAKTLEMTNSGKAPRILHDVNNVQVVINPGETKKVELTGATAVVMERASATGDTLKLGDAARRELERREDEEADRKRAEDAAAAHKQPKR